MLKHQNHDDGELRSMKVTEAYTIRHAIDLNNRLHRRVQQKEAPLDSLVDKQVNEIKRLSVSNTELYRSFIKYLNKFQDEQISHAKTKRVVLFLIAMNVLALFYMAIRWL